MSITDGLSEEAGADVNSLAGFEAAMTALGVEPDAGDETASDTSVANGLVTAPATEQTPEPEQESPEPDTPDAAPEADTATEEDPAVAAFLSKYNGDASAALKAAVEAQSVIGRQGQEMGTLREQIAELRGMVQAGAQPQAVVTQEDAEQRAAELVDSQGYFAAATSLANESLNGDTKAYDAVLANWVLENPIAAQRFDMDFQLWRRDQNTPTQADPTLARIRNEQGVNDIATTLTAIAAERGDSWESIAAHMDAAINQVHPSVAALVASSNPDDRMHGARIVADRASVLATAASAKSSAEAAAAQATQAATARKVAGSQVASGSLRPAAPEAGTPEQRADAITAFKNELLGTSDTNVARGLTYGKPR